MPLMFWQAKPLMVAGKLAMHERCCCGCCPGLPTLTLEVSGGQGGSEWCIIFNGTYHMTSDGECHWSGEHETEGHFVSIVLVGGQYWLELGAMGEGGVSVRDPDANGCPPLDTWTIPPGACGITPSQGVLSTP